MESQGPTAPRRTGRGKYARRGALAISPRRLLRRCAVLALPVLAGAALTAAAPGFVKIRTGDTLWELARTHHTSVAALKRVNHLRGDTIYAGEMLRLPGNNPRGSSARGGLPATRVATYRVRAGDTLSALAQRFGTSPTAIARRNRVPGTTIYVGQTLRIPVHLPAAHPEPSRGYVAAVIRDTARRLGVDPALALAVAYQESGFQAHIVSSAGAVGAMQVLPSTGRWLSQDVAGRPLDLRDVRDNAYAGVLQLKLLLNVADRRTAVAAYYQGLGSVRKHGLFADTKAYVASVLALRARFT